MVHNFENISTLKTQHMPQNHFVPFPSKRITSPRKRINKTASTPPNIIVVNLKRERTFLYALYMLVAQFNLYPTVSCSCPSSKCCLISQIFLRNRRHCILHNLKLIVITSRKVSFSYHKDMEIV